MLTLEEERRNKLLVTTIENHTKEMLKEPGAKARCRAWFFDHGFTDAKGRWMPQYGGDGSVSE